MPTVLFSRSNFDLVTSYLASYSAKLIDFAKQNGYTTVELYNDDPKMPARLSTFEQEILKKPDIFIGCSHGNSILFTGQDLEVLLKAGMNEDYLSDVKTYLWACETGAKLGPDAVAKTCPQFYGYLADWTFIYHPDYESRPLEDPYARAFFDCGLATGYALLLGKTPQEIYQATIDRYDYWFDYWQKQEDSMADEILTWLNWNRTNFIAITKSGIYEAPKTTGLNIPLALPVIGFASALLLLVVSTATR